MNKKIYVGNLPWSATEATISDLFSRHGEVISARVITDRDTGRSRGFGFVEMEGSEADAAIKALDGSNLDGRPLRVNEAQERGDRGGSGGGGGGRPPRGGGRQKGW
ncbi:MAG: RNA-binding protein [Deltaproteobacteria bacterium]|nr:RNA-binding protein [Deltaproteobacteria bacterium]